ncbi:MAG: hypothetical protein QOH35_5839, partial [Acidobacteriaceae bacterium]|nr:hypothetical protein [Acidobacteriaceae bacterium]
MYRVGRERGRQSTRPHTAPARCEILRCMNGSSSFSNVERLSFAPAVY